MATKKQTEIVEQQPVDKNLLFVEDNKIILSQKEKEIQDIQITLKQIIKERDERTQQIFDRDKEILRLKEETNIKVREVEVQLGNKIKELENQLALKLKQYEQVSLKFNDLAKLFDEYIKSSDDMLELQQMLLRNNLRTQELLQIKIKAFNGEGDKKQ